MEGVLHRLCSSTGFVQQVVRIYCDNQSAIFLAKKPNYHSNKNHIVFEYHILRDMAKENNIFLMKVDTLKNVSYSLTKYMSTEKLPWCRVSKAITTLDC
jgi:hypothetical protein